MPSIRCTLPIVSLLALALLLAAPPATAGTVVGGQVTDDAGAPLAGAEVELRPVVSAYEQALADRDEVFHPEAVTRAVSGEDGRFRLETPDDGFWDLVVTTPGRLPVEEDLGPLFHAEELAPVTPAEDAGLTVRVVDGAGKPVAGATVAVEREGLSAGGLGVRRWRWRREALPRRRAVTADDGTAVLPRRADEVLAVRAAAPGFAPAVEERVESARVTLTLRPGRPLTVEVRGPGGAPHAGAVLLADGVAVGRSDDAGRLQVHAPGDRPLTVHGLAAGELLGRLVLQPPEDGEAAAPPPAVLRLAAPVTVAGRTLGPGDGGEREPVAGARVWEPGRRHLAVLSDGRGNFALTRPAPLGGDEGGTLAAAADGRLPGRASLRPAQAAGGEPVTLLLPPAAAAAGRVVDDAGAPVAGVVVGASPREPGFARALHLAEQRARSGAGGAFRLAALTPGVPYRLEVRHPGYAPAAVELAALDAAQPRGDVEIVLRPGVTAFGTVHDLDGEPVPGAEVTLTRVPDSGGDMMAMARRLRSAMDEAAGASADRAGGFEIPDLAPGRYDLSADAAGFAPLTVPGVEVPRGEARVDLGSVLLEPGVSLSGTVVDAAGRPLEGAEVRVSGDRGMGFFRRGGPGAEEPVTTGADGAFRVDDLARDQRVQVAVRHPGHADRLVQGVRVPPEEPLVIVLEAASRLSGVVVDAAGEPVEDASVAARTLTSTGGPFGGYSRASTDASGRFTLDDVTAGEVNVSVSARGYVRAERSGLQVGVGEVRDDLRFELEPGAEIEGRVRDGSGRPVAEARVRVIAGEGGTSFRGTSAATDADGVYRLEGVPLGERTVAAEHADHLRGVRDLEVGRGVNRLDFRLSAGSRVSGRVLDPAGAPVAGATVMLAEAGGPVFNRSLTASSGEDGGYEISGVAPGRYQVTASKEGFAASRLEEHVEVTGAPLDGVDLQLARGARIVGRLLGVDLQQLAEATVAAGSRTPGLRVPVMGSVDYEGNFRIDGVGAGEWTVFAAIGGKRGNSETVTVEPGDREVYVELDMGGGFTLSGSVTLGGEPMAGAAVAVSGGGRSRSGYGAIDHQGRFRIEGLEAGEYELTVIDLRGGGQAHAEDIDLAGDREIVIDIPTAEVTGIITDAVSGAPLEGAEVRLEAEGERVWRGRMFSRRSDADGRFRLPSVPGGEYRLRAELTGYAPGETAVRVDGGAPAAGVELRLQPTRGLTLEVTTTFGAAPERVRVAAIDPAAAGGAAAGTPGSELGAGVGSGAGGGGAAPGTGPAATAPRAVFNDRLVTGEGGRVRLDSLPAGRWRLLVGGSSLATTAVEVTAPGPAVPVTLGPGAVLDVRVPELAESGGEVRLTAADGRPHLGLRWDGHPLASWELALGRTRVDGLPAGSYTVTATGDDGTTRSTRVTVPPGGRVEAVLE